MPSLTYQKGVKNNKNNNDNSDNSSKTELMYSGE